MRIGIDARELVGHATGAGRYLAGLLRQWAKGERSRAHEFLLYAPEPIGLALDARRFPTREVRGSAGWRWEQIQLPRVAGRDHLDVWFAPAYTAPISLPVPIVAAIHDISFVAHPEWFRVREGMRRRWLTGQTANRSRSVITISQFTKRELIERLNMPAAKIHVIPPGISSVSSVPSVSSSPESRTPNPGRVLYVGSVFNRRHVPDLIRAFGPIARAHPGAVLDLVGDNRSYPYQDLRQTIAAEGLQASVQWHAYVTDDQLRDLYAQARAFAFLSEYEGLGLTPLEALANGVPPVLLDTPIARESCGRAALYVRLHDVPGATRALEALLFDDTSRQPLLAAAPHVLARYSWPRAAAETLTVLERAVH